MQLVLKLNNGSARATKLRDIGLLTVAIMKTSGEGYKSTANGAQRYKTKTIEPWDGFT